jgi:hypothetical protein
MKPIKDWIQGYPNKKIRTLAMRNIIFLKQNNTEGFINVERSDFKSAIRAAFIWGYTIEGGNFWIELFPKL